jgi:hypothetical protein
VIRVGETVTVIGMQVDIGMPYFQLYIQDEGATPGDSLALPLTYLGQVSGVTGSSAVFEVIAAQADLNEAVFVLRGRVPGAVQVWIRATGEVHYGYPGPATWSGGASDPITLTVTE